MSPPPLQIAVAGCGPAGLAAALLLGRDGHRVSLFDQFAAPRPLGSGLMLQPTGLAVLAELGLCRRVLGLGRRIDRLFGRVRPSGRVVLDVRYGTLGPDRFGLAVHRAALFETLADAVLREGLAVETGFRIAAVDAASDRRPVLVDGAGRRHGPFDLVVDALGTRSPLAPAFGAPAEDRPRRDLAYGALWASLPWPTAGGFDDHALEQRYARASTMVGVMPMGRRGPGEASDLAAFFWSLKPADHAAWRRRGLESWKDEVRRLWPETEPLLTALHDPEQLTLARYAHHSLRRPVADRLAAIGDAAHAASPQLGQGANMALLDARALALSLREEGDLAAALARYAARRRWHVRFYQGLSAAFTPFYQSDSRALPVLRDHLVAPATRLPVARRFVAAVVAGTVLDPRPGLALRDTPRREAVPTAALADET